MRTSHLNLSSQPFRNHVSPPCFALLISKPTALGDTHVKIAEFQTETLPVRALGASHLWIGHLTSALEPIRATPRACSIVTVSRILFVGTGRARSPLPATQPHLWCRWPSTGCHMKRSEGSASAASVRWCDVFPATWCEDAVFTPVTPNTASEQVQSNFSRPLPSGAVMAKAYLWPLHRMRRSLYMKFDREKRSLQHPKPSHFLEECPAQSVLFLWQWGDT